MFEQITPFLIFFSAALLVGLLPANLRRWAVIIAPLVGLLNLWSLPAETISTWPFLHEQLIPMRVDKLSTLFGILFHIAALIGGIYSFHLRDRVQQVAGLLYAGSALGAVFAGDLLTLYIFWELLAISSAFLILARHTDKSKSAALRYLLIQVGSGLILLAGLVFHYHRTGSLAFNTLSLEEISGALIFLAFGIKACFPGLHNWLTDAYPEATPTGAVFLSAFTTKVAVYAFARAFPGAEPLIYIGATMAMFPIFYAVIENDLRRVLCYSMINQIGFMLVGIGLGTNLGINGAVAHAFNDVIFKGLLFMSMGAVLLRTGRMNGSDLGGLYKSMPLTTGFCMVGAASISAFPLFSGFVSKSMVMVAALNLNHEMVWLMLLFASAGVFHHAGIKIPFFAFYAHDSGIRCKEAPTNMLIAMGLASFLCIFNGSYPWFLYDLLPMEMNYNPYDITHVLTQVQLLFFSALAFVLLKKYNIYPPELVSTNIDAEWLYRRMLPGFMRIIGNSIGRAITGISSSIGGTTLWIAQTTKPQRTFLFKHDQTTNSSAILVLLFLGGYLVMFMY
ncbi:MAG: Na(+)/H(+) antiporter subunit D [Magnetococcales bacterium]|nr:Na(+)/H(+) antiporter subunit D [Magnetococcales bacterium]